MPETTRTRNPKTNYAPKGLLEKIQTLERENKELRHKLRARKRKTSGKIAYLLLFSGMAVLIWSIITTSQIPALIGISLIFWGALLLFISPGKYVKASLLEPTAISTFTNMNKIIANMKYEGKGVYLPPRYFKGFKSGKVFIPSKKEITIPPIEEIAQDNLFLENPQGISLTPLGLGLTNMFEDELGTDFTKADLEYLQNNLPKLFVEDLEIAEDLEMNIEGNVIQTKITGSIFKDFCKETRRLSNVCNSLGCPLCSSIACTLTRATGKPIIIEKTLHSEEDETIQAHYRILETQERILETQERSVSASSKPTDVEALNFPPGLVSLVLAVCGSIILAWVGWLVWYDITTWSKTLTLIFFGSRTGEAISLGIGMKVIHYFLIGLTLFILSLLMFFRTRRRAHIEE